VIQYVRAEEIARSLGVSRSTIFRAAAAGSLPSVRIGRSVRFSPEAVERWLAEHSAGNGASFLDHGGQDAPREGTR
jgi:excisionase family DNA binding protein